MKAYATRWVVAFLAGETGAFVQQNAGTMSASMRARANMMSTCLYAMHQYFRVVERAQSRLTAQESHSMLRWHRTVLRTYAWLVKESAAEGTHAGHIVPKFHVWQHIVEDAAAQRKNPRETSCWGDEDLIGKRLVLGGRLRDVNFAQRFFDHYRLDLALQWLDYAYPLPD